MKKRTFICVLNIEIYQKLWLPIAKNKLADISADFAVNILKLTDGIKGNKS